MGYKIVDTDGMLARIDSTLLMSLAISCLIMPTLNFVLHRALFTPLGKHFLGIKPAKKTDDDQDKQLRTLRKFEESAWKFCAYACLSAFSAHALADQTFWTNTSNFWTECSQLPCEYATPFRMRLAYAMDLAYYTYAVPYAVFYETKRKDFWATMAHHFVTVTLIVYSYAMGFTKVGVVIMFIHDICDAPLEVAKMAQYAKSELVTNIFFVMFMLTWIAMRVAYFPLYVIRSVVWEAWAQVIQQHGVNPWPHYPLFAGMLLFLWVLHVYWTFVILRIAYKSVMRGGRTEDDREDDDDS